jgi:hypothetical protein
MSRWLRFFIFLILGLAAGLLYGWVINPLRYVDTSPEYLSADYQTDYVLMVAEVYAAERDLETATRFLSRFSPQPPAAVVSAALDDARSIGYAPADLRQIESLWAALQALPAHLP